jgi:hypothetical protein
MNKPFTLWHASRADIDRPTIEGRIAGDNHANSGLGIYCATDAHDYIKNFGNHIHKMEVVDNARISRITVDDLRKMGSTGDNQNDRDWFEQERERLSKDYDVLLLTEQNGYASQAIILHNSAIASSQKVSIDDFDKQSISIEHSMKQHDANRQKMANAHAMRASMGY